jgi:site-specific recombinase XerD
MKPDLDNPAETITPRQARRQFLASKKGVVKDSTVRAYRFPTKHFVEYCENHGVETTSEINGYVIESWKQQRRSENIKIVTLHNNVKHLRVFVRWCETVDLVEQGLPDKITVPPLSDDEARSNDVLRLDHAEDVLRYLNTYEYGSRNHTLFQTLWHTGCRIGGALALDKGDFVQTREGALLQFRDRKSAGTALKNASSGERDVTINKKLRQTLVDSKSNAKM